MARKEGMFGSKIKNKKLPREGCKSQTCFGVRPIRNSPSSGNKLLKEVEKNRNTWTKWPFATGGAASPSGVGPGRGGARGRPPAGGARALRGAAGGPRGQAEATRPGGVGGFPTKGCIKCSLADPQPVSPRPLQRNRKARGPGTRGTVGGAPRR